jgi:protein arginine kinase
MGDKEEKSFIRELRDTTGHWVKGTGPLNHIVVSSRIRLARNIQDIPFPFKASDEQLRMILDKSEEFVKKNKKLKNYRLIRLNDLTAIDVQFLVEKRLISIAQAQFNRPYRAFIYNTDEVISIMVNEEDHYRIQCIQPGFQLKKVWELIDWYDDQIGEAIDYAFNENEGFLTCCPTNVGTGLRASVMMHLPALIVKNRLNDLMDTVSKAGYAVRGFYGEGTDFQGNLFQVSNQSTLGLKEEEIIEKLELVSSHLIEKEQEAREEVIIRSKHKIEDQVMRAYGVLTNAKMISTNEALDLLSQIRFGIELGILAKVGYDTINRLMLIIQPGYLQLLKGEEMDQEQRNLTRALLIQELLH